MGCDILWRARQPDIEKQQHCLEFLKDFWEAVKWDFDVFSEPLEGYFINYDEPKPITEKTTLNLLGVTGYFLPKKILISELSEICRHQISFVFNNSEDIPEDDRHRLVTFEQITDFSLDKYSRLTEYFKDTPMDTDSSIYGVYKEGAFERIVSSSQADNFISLFIIIRNIYLPDLEIFDDYGITKQREEWFEKEIFDNDEKSEESKYSTMLGIVNAIGEELYENKIEGFDERGEIIYRDTE